MNYQRHLAVSHKAWEKYQNAHIIIDATCGNGHDTLFLAQLKPQRLYAIDINPEAISRTKDRLNNAPQQKIHYFCQSHAHFPPEIESESVDLIVYNLGYLPGGNKKATTMTPTTLMSLNNALLLLRQGGMISITCYPGHPEGEKEERTVLEWARKLDKKEWNVVYSQWINREKSPSLILLEKNLGEKQVGGYLED